MTHALRVLCLLLFLTPSYALSQGWLPSSLGGQQARFLDVEEVFELDVTRNAEGEVAVRGTIAPGYYVYRERLAVEVDGTPVPLALPQGREKHDDFFGNTEVYFDTLDFTLGQRAAGTAVLHWQACAEAGICYPPQMTTLALPGSAGTAGPLPPGQSGTTGNALAAATKAQAPVAGEDQQFAARLANASTATSIALFFAMGFLLAFTPCTLPMIPIVSSMIVGGQPSTRRAVALSAAYVLPMALTYAALGVAAGLAGANLQAALQQPWLLFGMAAVFVALALAMFGAFELQLPAGLSARLQRAGDGRQGGTLAGAAALGTLSALLVGPCMTAPLAGALLFIGQSGDALTGGLALFALGLGTGLPLLLIAVFGSRILPKPGLWMVRVKALFGYLLLALAVSMIGRVVAPSVSLILWGAWLLAVALGLLAWVPGPNTGVFARWLPRYFAAMSAVWGIAVILGGASGANDLWRPLAHFAAAQGSPAAAPATTPAYVQAKTSEDLAMRIAQAGEQGQWTLVDFYADWCVSCHVIERNVFGDPRVAELLAQMQVVRPDVTANDAADRELMKTWQVAGPPTLLLIGPDGEERRAERTVGEIGADELLERLQRVHAEDV